MRGKIFDIIITVVAIIIAILVPELFWVAIGFNIGLWASYFDVPAKIRKAIKEHYDKR